MVCKTFFEENVVMRLGTDNIPPTPPTKKTKKPKKQKQKQKTKNLVGWYNEMGSKVSLANFKQHACKIGTTDLQGVFKVIFVWIHFEARKWPLWNPKK